ncbi:MASE1 domain-containing protein [Dyella psychrodurans]|uniref:MASE1 domain-containing protein n=1 Tax=Dyella psychrodurans TaxID=1927960 RepID=A0A370WX46_9GAMM|nr:MASE1 domain-containing protein [Dyella psychrodurans]RDS80704.1 hypothetical protein DWU99_19195 [Dyella psychrodurans]
MRSTRISRAIQTHRWLIHLAVALGYALVYLSIAQTLSSAPWPFVAGLRMGCLLLVPYRYWPALALGEVVPLAYRFLGYAGDWGVTAAVLSSIPPIGLAMPVVWWFRKRAAIFPWPHLVDVKKLLCCVLVLSVLWASTRYVAVLTVQTPTGAYPVAPGTAFSFFIDYYLALLSVTPWAVMVRLRDREAPWQRPSWRTMAANSLARDASIAVLMFAVLTASYRVVADTIKPVVMLVLFFPALGLALKHGWRASVLGGTLCLISISLLVEWKPDPGTQQIQAVLAFTITCLYVFGARLSMQMRLLEQLQDDTREAQQIAQKNLLFGEQRLRQSAQALECVVKIISLDYADVLQRFVPNEERDAYGNQAWALQQSVSRLAETLHPSAWRDRGLASALDETIGQVLREAGMSYTCDTPGRHLRFLSQALQVALYRMACEAIVGISASPACTSIRLALRTGRRDGIHWVAVRVDGRLDDRHVATAILQTQERERVAPKLGATAKTFDELQQVARLFQGKARLRATSAGWRYTALLSDAVLGNSRRRAKTTPVRLWVN